MKTSFNNNYSMLLNITELDIYSVNDQGRSTVPKTSPRGRVYFGGINDTKTKSENIKAN